MQEINEFYSYSEMDDLGSKRDAFEQAFGSSGASDLLQAVCSSSSVG